ncbi:YesL family protein [Gracilibacillus sp. D59]|uniref:YesL family protein n=1 Tax=Gracilibacillus sp. D59 TaxID=3457434 RepID=UPI003FCE8B9B
MNLFNNKLYTFTEGLSNLIILNFLWIISCIPIITIFPATSSMFSVIRKWKMDEGVTNITRNFFRHFKQNFTQSFVIGIIWFIFAVILYLDYYFMSQSLSGINILLSGLLILVSLLFLAVTAYIFPVLSHYQVTIKYAIKNSFLFSIAYFPTTIVIIINFALLVIILYIFPVSGLLIFSLTAFVNYSLCHTIFLKVQQLHSQPS